MAVAHISRNNSGMYLALGKLRRWVQCGRRRYSSRWHSSRNLHSSGHRTRWRGNAHAEPATHRTVGLTLAAAKHHLLTVQDLRRRKASTSADLPIAQILLGTSPNAWRNASATRLVRNSAAHGNHRLAGSVSGLRFFVILVFRSVLKCIFKHIAYEICLSIPMGSLAVLEVQLKKAKPCTNT